MEEPFYVEPMSLADVPAVMAIERQVFSLPWTERSYRYDLLNNKQAHYFVARVRSQPPFLNRRPAFGQEEKSGQNPKAEGQSWEAGFRELWQKLWGRNAEPTPPVVGYVGFWELGDEGHISTLASHPQYRHQGIASLLLLEVARQAVTLGLHSLTLEVRVSNAAAQALYRKFGFVETGRRLRYYGDNNEDALIMTLSLLDETTRQLLQRRAKELRARWQRRKSPAGQL